MSRHISVTDQVARSRVIPVVESRAQLTHILNKQSKGGIIMVCNCNVLELGPLLVQAHNKGYDVYVNIDHTNGVHADAAGLHYLAQQLYVVGIESTNPRTLALARAAQLTTVLHVYAADSAGLESALEVADPQAVDLLDISPALVIPYIRSALATTLSLPFVGSGLISTAQQVQAILQAGAIGALVAQTDFSL